MASFLVSWILRMLLLWNTSLTLSLPFTRSSPARLLFSSSPPTLSSFKCNHRFWIKSETTFSASHVEWLSRYYCIMSWMNGGLNVLFGNQSLWYQSWYFSLERNTLCERKGSRVVDGAIQSLIRCRWSWYFNTQLTKCLVGSIVSKHHYHSHGHHQLPFHHQKHHRSQHHW